MIVHDLNIIIGRMTNFNDIQIIIMAGGIGSRFWSMQSNSLM